eukprot:7320634-Pyramimonas_sp.AAC.1
MHAWTCLGKDAGSKSCLHALQPGGPKRYSDAVGEKPDPAALPNVQRVLWSDAHLEALHILPSREAGNQITAPHSNPLWRPLGPQSENSCRQ